MILRRWVLLAAVVLVCVGCHVVPRHRFTIRYTAAYGQDSVTGVGTWCSVSDAVAEIDDGAATQMRVTSAPNTAITCTRAATP